MALLRAVSLGTIAAIAVPFVLRDVGGLLGQAASWWTVRPVPGELGLFFSVPVFLGVAGLGWALLKAAER